MLSFFRLGIIYGFSFLSRIQIFFFFSSNSFFCSSIGRQLFLEAFSMILIRVKLFFLDTCRIIHGKMLSVIFLLHQRSIAYILLCQRIR